MVQFSRSFSDQLLLLLPLLCSLFLLVLHTTPALLGIAYLPQMLCFCIFFWRVYYPAAMPYGVVFLLGLFYDFLSGAPLGCYALSGLFSALLINRVASLVLHQPFRLVWAAACVFLLMFLLLSLAVNLLALSPVTWATLVKTMVASMVSYPLWHGLFRLILRIMPAGLARG